MPASKIELFSFDDKETALIGRAFAHPARIQIYNILNDYDFTRNIDLTKMLKLTKSTIHNHLRKLEDAGMIRTVYHEKSLLISKNSGANERLLNFKNKLSNRMESRRYNSFLGLRNSNGTSTAY
jgi:DNA-binding transcriptional ArsR family regulator